MFIKHVYDRNVKYILSPDEALKFEAKIKAFDDIVEAIEKPNNNVKLKLGWSYEVAKIYKNYKREVSKIEQTRN